MTRKLLDVAFWLALSTYFGGLLILGAIVAPAVFATTADKHINLPGVTAPPLDPTTQAGGEIFGVILLRFEFVEAAALLILGTVIALWLLKLRLPRPGTWLLALGWLIITALTLYNAMWLTPRVLYVRDQVRTTAAQHTDPKVAWPDKESFDSLHIESTRLAQFKLLILLGMVCIGAWRNSTAKPNPRPPAPKPVAAVPIKKP